MTHCVLVGSLTCSYYIWCAFLF